MGQKNTVFYRAAPALGTTGIGLTWHLAWPGLMSYLFMPCLDVSTHSDCPLGSHIYTASIPSQFHFHPISIPSLCPFRFPLPSPFPLLGRSGFCSHSRSCSLVAAAFMPMTWPGLAWPGARARPSLRSCRAFQRGDFASKMLQVCCVFLILPRGGLAVLTVVAA